MKKCVVKPDASTCEHCLKVKEEDNDYILHCENCSIKNVECELLRQYISNPGSAVVKFPNGKVREISRSRISEIVEV